MKISEMTISEAHNVYHVNFGEAFENHYDWLYSDDVKKMWKNINELYSKLNSLELNSLYFGFDYYKAEKELSEIYKKAIEDFKNICPFEWDLNPKFTPKAC